MDLKDPPCSPQRNQFPQDNQYRLQFRADLRTESRPLKSRQPAI